VVVAILQEDAALSNSTRGEVDRLRLLSEAIRLTDEFGWSVIATDSNKLPVGPWKRYQAVRPTRDELARMFLQQSAAGLAVIAGPVSGDLVCRDFDIADNYVFWAEHHHALADTLPTVRTPRGWHVLFRCPGLTKIAKLGDGELRGAGYSLLPPSLHSGGQRYHWQVEPTKSIPTFQPAEVVALGLAARPDTSNKREAGEALVYVRYRACASEVGGREGFTNPLNSRLPPGVEEIVAGTLPTKVGERNDLVFELALRLKSLDPMESPESFRSIVEEWHQRALPAIRTKPFAETWNDFRVAWRRIKGSPISWSAVLAEAATISVPPRALELSYSEPRQKLIRICVAAQRLWGDQPFFLSARQAAEACGLSKSAAHDALARLERDGILRCERKGKRGSNGRATLWRCLIAS
jgi:hypothetical protein